MNCLRLGIDWSNSKRAFLWRYSRRARASTSSALYDLWSWRPGAMRKGYFLVESRGTSEPLPVAEPRLGRRTALTFPLLPPPQKN